MQDCMSHGVPLPSDLVAELADSAASIGNHLALADRLREDGYLFLRSVLPVGEIIAARHAVLRCLAEVGEVATPIEAGIWSGTSRRHELVQDAGAFWQRVSEHSDVRRVSHGAELRQVVENVLGEPAVAHDMLYLRAGVRGRATDLHYDYPFFARTTGRTLTAWVPLGDVPVPLGPLVVVEGSNRFVDLLEQAMNPDAGQAGRRAALPDDAAALARSRSARLLTRNFRAGDVAILSMFVCHGSLDNHSDGNEIRLSFDLRFQPSAVPRDSRFFGNPPKGLTGHGYRELNGAKPLTEEWHQR
jgi:ectoine hydroxylase-related dioxygenase (phytanoyl-CoA dioxygenase family)